MQKSLPAHTKNKHNRKKLIAVVCAGLFVAGVLVGRATKDDSDTVFSAPKANCIFSSEKVMCIR